MTDLFAHHPELCRGIGELAREDDHRLGDEHLLDTLEIPIEA